MYREDRSSNNAARWTQSSLPWTPTSDGRFDDDVYENDVDGDVTAADQAVRLRNGVKCPTNSRRASQSNSGRNGAAMEAQNSEPSTPSLTSIADGNGGQTISNQSSAENNSRNPARPMLRNLSDLGPRIKKRVTYSAASSTNAVVNSSSSSAIHAQQYQQNPSTVVTASVFVDPLRRGPCSRSAFSGPRHQPSIVSEEDEEPNGMTGEDDAESSPGSRSNPDDSESYNKVTPQLPAVTISNTWSRRTKMANFMST